MHMHCTLILKNWDFPCSSVLIKAKRHYGADVNTSKAQFVLLLRIERTKKKRVEAQTDSQREKKSRGQRRSWKCRGREAQAWNWKSVEVWNEGQRTRGAAQETSRESEEMTHWGGFDALALVDVAVTFQTSVFHTFTLSCLWVCDWIVPLVIP